jgi:hypothetical protein
MRLLLTLKQMLEASNPQEEVNKLRVLQRPRFPV